MHALSKVMWILKFYYYSTHFCHFYYKALWWMNNEFWELLNAFIKLGLYCFVFVLKVLIWVASIPGVVWWTKKCFCKWKISILLLYTQNWILTSIDFWKWWKWPNIIQTFLTQKYIERKNKVFPFNFSFFSLLIS